MSADLDNRFNYHKATPEQGADMDWVRWKLRDAAESIMDGTPAGREQALAITKLEEAMFWANAAIARQGEQA